MAIVFYFLFLFRRYIDRINNSDMNIFLDLIMSSMSPCTIEKDVVDAMKKFRRSSNKASMAILCK
jgi:hypothetical protein